MTARFVHHETALPGVYEITRQRLGDARGYLERMFCAQELGALGWTGPVAQANRTLTQAAGTIRGMHCQTAPHAEIKLVTCLAGRICDVALDLRTGSPTFGQHAAVELDAEKGNALLIPEGCAHGFQTLTDNCEVFYFHSRFYAPDHETGVNAMDAALGLAWPLPMTERSARDAALPPLSETRLPGVAF